MIYLININKLMIPSIALATLKVLVNRQIDEEVRLLDLSPVTMIQDLEKLKMNEEQDVAGFTASSFNLKDVLLFIKKIKEKYPKLCIIVGGPMVSSIKFSQQLIKNHKEIDIIVRGRADQTFPQLIKFLRSNDIYGLEDSEIYNLTWKVGQDILVKPDMKENNIDFLTYSPWLLEAEYLIENYKKQTSSSPLPYGTGYGCPNKCTYCVEARQQFRPFSLDRVTKELAIILKSGIKSIFFYDSTFGYSKKRGLKLLEFISQHNTNVAIYSYVDINHIDREYLEFAKRVNVKLEGIGLQTVDPHTSAMVKRNPPDLDKIRRMVNSDVLQSNLNARIGMIYGLPEENFIKFKHTLNFAMSLRANDNLGLHRYCNYPGTELYETCIEYRRLSETDPEVISGPGVSETDIINCNKTAAGYCFFRRCFPFTLTVFTHLTGIDPAGILLRFVNQLMETIPDCLHAPVLEIALGNKYEVSHERLEPIVELILHQPKIYAQLMTNSIIPEKKEFHSLLNNLFELDISLSDRWNRKLRIRLESKNRLKNFIDGVLIEKGKPKRKSLWFFLGNTYRNFPVIIRWFASYLKLKYAPFKRNVLLPQAKEYQKITNEISGRILLCRTVPLNDFIEIYQHLFNENKKIVIDCLGQESIKNNIHHLNFDNIITIPDGPFNLKKINAINFKRLVSQAYDFMVIPSNNPYFKKYTQLLLLALKIKPANLIMITKHKHMVVLKGKKIKEMMPFTLINRITGYLKLSWYLGSIILSHLIILPLSAIMFLLQQFKMTGSQPRKGATVADEIISKKHQNENI